MASKFYNLLVGGASVGTGVYLTTWLTGENTPVCIHFILFSIKKLYLIHITKIHHNII